MLSFIDAFFGYNQIIMNSSDQEKILFITDWGLYYYQVPFGLKNVSAMNQRLVNHLCEEQIGCNMEVYVENIVVKSREPEHHIANLHDAFHCLATIQNEAQLDKVHIQSGFEKIHGLQCLQTRDQGQSQKNKINNQHESTREPQ